MSSFEWLSKEIASVKNSSFYQFEGCSVNSVEQFEAENFKLPRDYRDFAFAFGNTKLFRDPRSNWHRLKVQVPPNPFGCSRSGDQLFQIGYYVNSGYACYVVQNRKVLDSGAIFQGDVNATPKLYDSFSNWLIKSFQKAKRSYPKEFWGEMTGPILPFDERERVILAALPDFQFTKVGVTSSGNLLIRIENRSSISIPFLTVGVRWPKLEGRLLLSVSDIGPNSSKVVETPCYNGAVDPTVIELFRLPLPTPAERRYFKELHHS